MESPTIDRDSKDKVFAVIEAPLRKAIDHLATSARLSRSELIRIVLRDAVRSGRAADVLLPHQEYRPT